MPGLIEAPVPRFAVTISVAILISGIVSLTVTPMLCGWLIDTAPDHKPGRLYLWCAEPMFVGLNRGYMRLLDVVLRHQVITMAVMLATVGLTGWLFVVVPKGLFPQVDTSLVMGIARGAPDISFDAMSGRIGALGKIAMADPAVNTVDYWIGFNPTVSQGRILLNLKPLNERADSASAVIARLRRQMAGVVGITQGMQVRQDIQVGGRLSAAQYQYTLQDPDVAELYKWSSILEAKFNALPQLRDVSSDQQPSATSATLEIDRPTASRMGVSVQAIDDILRRGFRPARSPRSRRR